MGHSWLEGADAVAQQDGYCAGNLIRYDNIQFAVAIYIRDHQEPVRVSAGGVADPLLESAVAVTQQHAYATPPHVRFQDIQVAIAVHIRDCHATGVVSAGIVDHG